MKDVLRKLVTKLLRETADKIDANTCELTDEEASDIIGCLSHQPLSKEEACSYLNVSRATFDNHVRLGNIPKGRKRRGFKELYWYKDEISNVMLG